MCTKFLQLPVLAEMEIKRSCVPETPLDYLTCPGCWLCSAPVAACGQPAASRSLLHQEDRRSLFCLQLLSCSKLVAVRGGVHIYTFFPPELYLSAFESNLLQTTGLRAEGCMYFRTTPASANTLKNKLNNVSGWTA